MNLDVTEDQKQIREAVRELCRGEFAAHATDWDRDAHIPDAVLAKLADMGLYGMAFPEEWGGVGYDLRTIAGVIEEIAQVSASLAILIAVHNSVGGFPIYRFGTEAQKKRFLPRLTTREIGAFSLSEPGAGSDTMGLEATAVRQGDEWVLNGTKNWVTNGQRAWTTLVFARTGPRELGSKGISCFIVERGMPGLFVGKSEDKMGLRGSDTVTLSLEDLRVPADHLLGVEGEGLRIALGSLESGRVIVASQALGIAVAAFHEAVKYAQQRKAFGGPIAKIQAVQFKLAEMERRISASRLLIQRAAWLKDTGKPSRREAAMAKLYATETATWVTHQAIQVHGGYGYVKEYPVERYYRDARVTEIYEGTSEIQRLVIARDMLEHGLKI